MHALIALPPDLGAVLQAALHPDSPASGDGALELRTGEKAPSSAAFARVILPQQQESNPDRVQEVENHPEAWPCSMGLGR